MSFVLLFIVISSVAGGILTWCGRYMYALIVSDRARQLTVALGIKIDELRHCMWIWLVETRDILLTLVLYVNCFVVRFFMGKISWLLCISSGLALLLCSLVLLAIFLLQEIYWQRQFFFSDNGPVMCFSTPHRSWEKLQFSIALLSSLEWGCTRPITATQ